MSPDSRQVVFSFSHILWWNDNLVVKSPRDATHKNKNGVSTILTVL